MASSQPHLLTNPHLQNDQKLLGQLEFRLLPHVAAQLAVIRLSEVNKRKIKKARNQWASGKASR
jgi:hypothetical protein